MDEVDLNHTLQKGKKRKREMKSAISFRMHTLQGEPHQVYWPWNSVAFLGRHTSAAIPS
jgi:hypothetical protein